MAKLTNNIYLDIIKSVFLRTFKIKATKLDIF